ncbi:hypothetical protein HOA92_05755 [archaeon]|jgi:hypothetical protein|nr:hypothetical protein [archaeon]MBT6762517.1 hypothetical protein [archaeon]
MNKLQKIMALTPLMFAPSVADAGNGQVTSIDLYDHTFRHGQLSGAFYDGMNLVSKRFSLDLPDNCPGELAVDVVYDPSVDGLAIIEPKLTVEYGGRTFVDKNMDGDTETFKVDPPITGVYSYVKDGVQKQSEFDLVIKEIGECLGKKLYK